MWLLLAETRQLRRVEEVINDEDRRTADKCLERMTLTFAHVESLKMTSRQQTEQTDMKGRE